MIFNSGVDPQFGHFERLSATGLARRRASSVLVTRTFLHMSLTFMNIFRFIVKLMAEVRVLRSRKCRVSHRVTIYLTQSTRLVFSHIVILAGLNFDFGPLKANNTSRHVEIVFLRSSNACQLKVN